MLVGGRRFTRGFGVRGSSRISVEVQGRCGSLVVSYGLDDASAASARIVFAVNVDGTRVLTPMARKRGDRVLKATINLVGKATLELVTQQTRSGLGFGQWIEPVLACGPQSPYLPSVSISSAGFTGALEPGRSAPFSESISGLKHGNMRDSCVRFRRGRRLKFRAETPSLTTARRISYVFRVPVTQADSTVKAIPSPRGKVQNPTKPVKSEMNKLRIRL